jgi:hypothetical protein
MRTYGWIFKYDDRFIIKDRDCFYIINYNIEGLIERSIKENLGGNTFIMVNKDMICVYKNNFYYTSMENNECIWNNFHSIPIPYVVIHTASYKHFLIYTSKNIRDLYDDDAVWIHNDENTMWVHSDDNKGPYDTILNIHH